MRQMKIFAYIVSVIILMLTVNPCIDEHKANAIHNSEISQASNHENHENEADHCSPFCTCQCCQTNFIVSAIPTSPGVAELTIRYIEQSTSFHSLDLIDFYIPPKS